MLAVASQIVVGHPDHPRRRSTDRRDPDLPEHLYDLPAAPAHDSGLAFLIGELRGEVGGLHRRLDDRFDSMGERIDMIETDVKAKLDDLRTAVTWRGILKSIPVIASIVAIIVAAFKGWSMFGSKAHL